jgi:hypothetical protein
LNNSAAEKQGEDKYSFGSMTNGVGYSSIGSFRPATYDWENEV